MEPEGPEAVLAALDPEQREVALATRGPVCVIAGAGTGKTRAIAHRIAYGVRTGVINPGHVLAVTFTTRAAGELRGRLRRLGGAGSAAGLDRVVARTFHAAALRQLVHFWPVTVGGRPPAVLDSKIGLLSEAARAARVRLAGPELRDVATEIEWAKVTQVRPADYAEAAGKFARTPPLRPELTGRVFGAYEELRRERHLVDFESVLELTAAMLAGHRRAAAQVRDRYRYFVVDEYQDVNPLQKLLLDTWAGDGDDVCVVGDPRQTIYSFTGATSAYLTGFAAEYPHARVIRLVRNYRSTPEVIACANRVTGADMAAGGSVGGEPGRPARRAPAGGARAGSASGGAVGGPALVAQRESGAPVTFTEHDDEVAEAAWVAAQARRLIAAGMAPRDLAVLVRVNVHTERFERAFADAGVPCQVRGAERFFERAEVRQAMGLLRVAARSAAADTAGGRPGGGAPGSGGPGSGPGGGGPGGVEPGGARTPGDGAVPGGVSGAGGSTGAGPSAVPGGAQSAGRSAGPGPSAVSEVRNVLSGIGLTRQPPAGRGAARDRWESLAALAQLAEDFCSAAPGAGLGDLVAELAHRASTEDAPQVEGVTVASLHAAKGLEWDVVFLPGLTEGNLPIIHAETDGAVAEERRLFYVGVTRAKDQLLLSWALARAPGGRRGRRPSRFLDGLPPGRRAVPWRNRAAV